MQVQVQKHEMVTNKHDLHQNIKGNISKSPTLISTQDQILQEYPDIFEGIGKFLGSPYHI